MKNVLWKSTGLQLRRIVSDTEAGSLTMSLVRPQEVNRVLTIQTSSISEDTWVFKAHAPPTGVYDKKISALKVLANLQEKERFVDSDNDGMNEGQQEKDGGGVQAAH